MEGDLSDNSKVCVICCQTIVGNDEMGINGRKLIKFCEDIFGKEDNDRKGKWRVGIFGMSVCERCGSETRELGKVKEKRQLLENTVIKLQMEILKGLRELEKCLEIVEGHRINLKKAVEDSDELCLRRRLDCSRREADCLAFKLRKWIVNDGEIIRGKVKGNLWISETEEINAGKEPLVKMEIPEESTNLEDDDNNAFNNTWDDGSTATDEIDEKPVISRKLNNSSKSRTHQNNKVREMSTMTLRTRSSRKLAQEIPVQNSKPLMSAKRKVKKNKKTEMKRKSIFKPNSKRKKPHVPRRIRQCDLCPFSTREEPSFEQHLRHHENEADPESKSLQCPNCPSKFSTKQYFNFHQKCHQGLHKLRCDICAKMIPVFSLMTHLKSHFPPDDAKTEPPPPKIISCQNCSFCCTSRHTYLDHIKRHKSQITSGIFSCDICSENFSSKKFLLKHFHDKHKGTLDKWPCDFPNCGKVLISRGSLVRHKWGHSQVKLFSCSLCDRKFAKEEILEGHLRSHSGEKPFTCEICGKKFQWKATLEGHKRNEHGDGPKFQCEICKKEFNYRPTLDNHLKKVHSNLEERISCEICGKTFKYEPSLRKHLETHEEDCKYSCEKCGKGFKTGEGLKLHGKVHGGEKNWKCEYCEKAFLRKENLRDHLRVHTGERPFVCEICGKDFNQRSALKTHKKNQHPN